MAARDIQHSVFSNNSGLTSAIALCSLIFLSIVPLASEDVWFEAIVLAVIFGLSAVRQFSHGLGAAGIETRQLLLPLFLLALYSFFHGILTIFIRNGSFGSYGGFVGSFDLTASIWSGFKILAFTLFLGLLFTYFRQRVRLLTWSLLLTGNFFAVFGIVRSLLQSEFPELFTYVISGKLAAGIGFGTYFNQNHFAYLMLMVFGLNLGMFWFGNQPKWMRLLLVIASVTTWTALVLTGSRGGIIGSFAEIAVLILFPVVMAFARRQRKHLRELPSKLVVAVRQLAILLAVFVFLIVGIVLVGQDRVVERFEDIPGQLDGITNSATFRRTDVWEAAVSIIKNYPVFGIGFGGFRVAVSKYIDISGQLAPKQAHNDYLELAVSGGIIAVALAIWFLFRFFSLLKKRFAEPSDPFSTAARVGAICGITGVAFQSFFEFGLQITANVLFFTALLFLAVHRSQGNAEPDTKAASTNNRTVLNFLPSISVLILACLALAFGFAKYQIQRARAAPSLDLMENELYTIPFDADYYEARSDIYWNAGNAEAAESELDRAVVFRPNAYDLWLKIASLQVSQNHAEQAEAAFQRAIELAPLYAEPHFIYGKFLIRTERKDQGFMMLRFAALRNPSYFDQILKLAWAEKGGNAAETSRLLSPLATSEKEKLMTFLSDKGEFAAIAKFGCGADDLPDASRDALVRNLIEKRRYFAAGQIHKKSCIEGIEGEIEDSSFESGILREGIGFGWRFQSSADNTTFAFDKGVENSAGESLRLTFNGKEEAAALISQIVVIEKGQKYNLAFSYKTDGIVTGGVPVLQVVLKTFDSEDIIKEMKLSLKNVGWVQSSIEFAANERTEAVEIRLTRQTCPETICPIFGKLWLDDFNLRKSN